MQLTPTMAMARSVALLALAVSCWSASTVDARSSSTATPITKVLELMNDMLAKGIADKKEAAVEFSAFMQWCTDQKRIKTDEIEAGNAKIEQLKAQIAKHAAEIRSLTDRIFELDEDVARWQKDTKSATDVRGKEKTDFEATLADYSETLSALDEAIAVLKEQAAKTPQADFVQALLQLSSRKALPHSAKSALKSLLQTVPSVTEMPDDDLVWKAPEAYAYEFQSQAIVDLFVKLKADFGTEKTNLMQAEVQAEHIFEQVAQQLADNIENAQYEIEKKKVKRANTEGAKAEAEGDLSVVTKERDADHKYLDTALALCRQKTNDFENRQDLRAAEIKTLQEAIEVISSDTVAGAGDRHLPSLSQVQPTSFAQLRSSHKSPLQEHISSFLAERAKQTGSRLLSQVSQRVAQDPFTKVKKLIKDLIIQLMEEATSETEHKGWCDTELTTNKQTRDKKTAEFNSLKTEMEDLNVEIAKLTQDLEDLAVAIEELEEAMAKATKERTASKATNEQTVKEAKEAQAAVEAATAVLKDYYAKSAQATALVQQTPAEDAPETFVKPYTGMLPEAGTVVDFLEVILTNFVRLETETTMAEASEENAYETFIFASKKDKALKENDSKHKTEKKSDKEGVLQQAQADLRTTQEQLDKAMNYYDKLKPTCVRSGISYESRVKQRDAEIQSLQQALNIITGKDFARPRTATA